VENHQKKCCGKELPEKIENCQKKAARNFCRKNGRKFLQKMSAKNSVRKGFRKRDVSFQSCPPPKKGFNP